MPGGADRRSTIQHSAAQPSLANRDLQGVLGSAGAGLSASDSAAALGARGRGGVRAFVEEAASVNASPGPDYKPVREVPGKAGRPGLKTRQASAAGPSKASARSRAGGDSVSYSARKGEKRNASLGKYTSDQVDKIYEYERENTALKSKQNLLEAEIEKMNTKLTRINELMVRKNKGSYESSKGPLPSEVEQHLQDEVSKLTSENELMREKNKKLRAIEKELTANHINKKATTKNKYAHVKGKLAGAKVK